MKLDKAIEIVEKVNNAQCEIYKRMRELDKLMNQKEFHEAFMRMADAQGENELSDEATDLFCGTYSGREEFIHEGLCGAI